MEEYKQCEDCVHRGKDSPCPCDSCEQPTPTNYTDNEEAYADDDGDMAYDSWKDDQAEKSYEESIATEEAVGIKHDGDK